MYGICMLLTAHTNHIEVHTNPPEERQSGSKVINLQASL